MVSRFWAVFDKVHLNGFPWFKSLVYNPTNVTTYPVTSPWTCLSVCISVKTEKHMIVHGKKGSIFTFFVSRVGGYCFYTTGLWVPSRDTLCRCVISLTFYCQFERMSLLVLLLFFYKKKKNLQMDLPHLLKIPAVFFSHHCDLFVLELCADYVQFQSLKNKKIALNISPPRQPHRWFLWHASAQFRRLGRRSFVYEMKTTRIKGHGGLKMSDINSPNKTRVCCCLPVLSHSFLWETTPPSSTGDGFFVFWLTTGVAHEEPCCYGYCFIYMLTYKFTSKAYPN